MTDAKPVVLITGAAKRVGAEIARHLHAAQFDIALHYRNSAQAAIALAAELNHTRPNSCEIFSADLSITATLPKLIEDVVLRFHRLDALINNASSFYRTPVGASSEAQWDDLFASNAKAPYFLTQAAAPHLRTTQGSIINVTDLYAERPLPQYPIYCMAKAALVMMTKSLAIELGPEIRVNAIAPGAILWPEDGKPYDDQVDLLKRTALKRSGQPSDIARSVEFLLGAASFISGEVLHVDGGRYV